MYDAIVLAGGENTRLQDGGKTPYEALVEIAGQPMVLFVVQALAQSSQVERIFVVGPAALNRNRFPGATTVVPGGETIIDTIRRGMQALGHQRQVLVATADIPLLTAAAVEDFISRCQEKQADLYYPIVRKEANEQRYPGTRRTYVKFREGTFTGGNIFLVNPAIVPRCLPQAERLIAYRKKPFQLARLLGWGFVCRFLLGCSDLLSVEKRVEELLNIRGAVVQSPYPEVGIDVDKPSDLAMVRRLFSIEMKQIKA